MDGRRFDEVRQVDCESSRMKDYKVSCTVTQTTPNTRILDADHLHFSSNFEAENHRFVENALVALLPEEEYFPYVIGVNTQVVCHDGSASTASVCGGSIALMDAGVPQRGHVAGVSMGLVREVPFGNTEHRYRYRILTDLSSLEEQLGDMNFKIAGSWEGITAVQLDLNVAGVPLDIIFECLGPGLKARLQILDRMEQEISVPRYCVSNDWSWPYPIIAKYVLPARPVKLNANGRWLKCDIDAGRFERDTGSQITSIEEGGIITVIAGNKTRHEQVLNKVDDMDGIEVEVDYSRYYGDS
ncbi:hypothetical protein MKW94_023676 [Papaver nudicaule]|uniref:Exoribonuclease phosphorolytic domain-containing protein n=1 Tax=Papaver nudicaule TaxID=74823 RepID=A0AA41UVN4_PAPNU|nr:hypothetical protein [Papaver nudicaule]